MRLLPCFGISIRKTQIESLIIQDILMALQGLDFISNRHFHPSLVYPYTQPRLKPKTP